MWLALSFPPYSSQGVIDLLKGSFAAALLSLKNVFLDPNVYLAKHIRALQSSTRHQLQGHGAKKEVTKSDAEMPLHHVQPGAFGSVSNSTVAPRVDGQLPWADSEEGFWWKDFKEARECFVVIRQASAFCHRNVHQLHPDVAEDLWFGCLTEVVKLQRSLPRLQGKSTTLRLAALSTTLSQLVSDILNAGLMAFLSLPITLKRITMAHRDSQLGIFKLALVRILLPRLFVAYLHLLPALWLDSPRRYFLVGLTLGNLVRRLCCSASKHSLLFFALSLKPHNGNRAEFGFGHISRHYLPFVSFQTCPFCRAIFRRLPKSSYVI